MDPDENPVNKAHNKLIDLKKMQDESINADDINTVTELFIGITTHKITKDKKNLELYFKSIIEYLESLRKKNANEHTINTNLEKLKQKQKEMEKKTDTLVNEEKKEGEKKAELYKAIREKELAKEAEEKAKKEKKAKEAEEVKEAYETAKQEIKAKEAKEAKEAQYVEYIKNSIFSKYGLDADRLVFLNNLMKEDDLEQLKKHLLNFINFVETTTNKHVSSKLFRFDFNGKNKNIKIAIDMLRDFVNSIQWSNKYKVFMYLPVLIIALSDNISSVPEIESIIKSESNNEKSDMKETFSYLKSKLYFNDILEGHQLGGKKFKAGKKSKKLPKKEILGKMRCIYKIPGDRKEYLKHKGKLITVKEYKELMKAKPKKKEAKPKKVKKTNSKK